MTRYSQYRIAFGVVLVAAFVSAASMLLRAEPPQAVGTWASIGATPDSRIGAAAVALSDGRTLIAGGSIQGTPTDTVVIFDPADGSFASAGQLLAPRAGHTATLLDDGRVLIVGGTVAGLLRNDLELFDPSSGTSEPSATMPQPRSGHAAARLADGKVLIVGGTTTDGVVLQTAEIFDPSTGSTTPTTLPMLMPRTRASATTLIDGRVLIAGGSSNGSVDLASAEIYQPWSQLFEAVDTGMSVARSGHAAVLLPWNNSVLIAGGSSDGVAQLTSDLFLPAEFPDPYLYGIGHFGPTGSMAAPRVSAVAAPHIEGYAVAMGGGAPDAEVYRFATVKTDKDDYAPGVHALITGSGWEPNSEVTLLFQEDPAVHDDYVLPNVPTDSEGNFTWDQWAPEEHDLNVRFYLMAKQATPQGDRRAQTTFTDSKVNKVTVAAPTAVTVAAGNTATYGTVTIELNGTFNTANPSCTATLGATGLPTGANPVFGTNPVTSTGANQTSTFSVTTASGPSATPPGTYTFTVTATDGTGCQDTNATPSNNLTLVVTAGNTAPVASAVSISGTAQYGQLLTGNYTYSDANSDAQGTSTFRWLRNGSTVVGTSLTYTTVSADVGQTLTFEVTPVAATGTSPGTAVQSSAVPIGKAPLTVTASSHTVTYGDPVPTVTPSYATFVSPDNAAGIDTPPICTTTYTTTSAALSSQSTSCSGGSDNNYAFSFVPGTVTVNKRNVTATAGNGSNVYDGATHSPSACVVSGAYIGGLSCVNSPASVGPNIGTTAISPVTSGADLANFTVTPVNGSYTIDPALVTATAGSGSGSYNGATQSPSACVVSGAYIGGLSCVNSPASVGPNIGTTAISPVTSGADLANFTVTPVNGSYTIDPALVTATAGSGSGSYNGATQSPSACVVSGAFIGGLSCVNNPASVGPGVGTTASSPVTSGADLANFTVTPVTGSYTISPAEVTATAGSGSNVYDGATHSPSACVVSGAFIGGLSCVNSPASVGPGVGTTASSPVTSGADLANFTVTPVNGSYTISPAEVTATAGSGSNVYDGATHSPAACVVSGAFIGGLSCVNSPASVGPGVGTTASSPVTSGADLANFTVTPVNGSYTISPAEVTATAGSGSNVYDGATHSPAACVVSGAFIGGLSCVNNPASVGPGVGTTASSPVTSGVDLANFTVTPVNGSYTISPAEVTATAGSGSNVYDGATHSPSACVVSGAFIGGLSCVNSPASVGPGVGTTASSPVTSGADLANFTVTPVNGSYTISPAEVTATAGSGSNVYDGATHSPAACVVSGAFIGGLSCVNSPASVGPGVGTTASSPVTSGADLANFTVTPVNGSYTISPAEVTATAGSGSNVYDGATHSPAACVVSGAFIGGLSCVNNPASVGPGVGTTASSPVTSGVDLANFTVTPVNGSYTISPAEVTATAGSGSNVYDGATHSPSACVVSGAFIGGLSCVNSPASVGPGVGTTASSPVTSGADLANFTVTPVNGSYTISPAEVTATGGSGSNVYDGATHSPAACVVSGAFIGGLSCVNSPASVGPGVGTTASSPVTSGADLANFTVTPVAGSYAISQATSSVTVTCTAGSPHTYTGNAQTPCTAEATGAGMSPVNVTSSLTYANNTNAGAATANASWGGDANHTGNTGSGGFTIAMAPLSVTSDAAPSTVPVDVFTKVYNGAVYSPFTVRYYGFVNGETPLVLGGTLGFSGPGTTAVNPGTYGVTPGGLTSGNYLITNMSGTLTISYGTCSASVGEGGVILAPINSDGTSVYNRKGGSTIPVKFRVCDASGNPITSPSAVFGVSGGSITLLSAVRGTVTVVNEATTADIPDVAFRVSGNQWIFNMATSNLEAGATYTFRINLAVGSIQFKVGVK